MIAPTMTRADTTPYVLDLEALGELPEAPRLAWAGGKAASLGELVAAGFPVPPGFCVTTAAFRAFMGPDGLDGIDIGQAPSGDQDLERRGEALRRRLQDRPIPAVVKREILAAWRAQGEHRTFAVRSSAIAEDLPGASFAGQYDTRLEVEGEAALVEAIRSCWISRFSARALVYRDAIGVSERTDELAVIVQRMVRPRASGVMFTAHPVDGRRHVVSIDAVSGLGESLVSGLVRPDHHEIDTRTGAQLRRDPADKTLDVTATGGGASHEGGAAELGHAPLLDDPTLGALVALGRRLEAHRGQPQDIEWCEQDGALWVVQSRPITTLFPIPQGPRDAGLRVYLSFGHEQVMTDAMPPVAHGLWRRVFPLDRDEQGLSRVLLSGGGRLYFDLTEPLRLPLLARRAPRLLRSTEPRIAAAVAEVVARPELRRAPRRLGWGTVLRRVAGFALPVLLRAGWRVWFARTRALEAWTRARLDARVAELRARLAEAPDPRARLLCVWEALGSLLPDTARLLMPSLLGAVASRRLLERLLGSRAAEDDLTALERGLRGNVTTEMDLAVGDLADVVRRTPALAEALRGQQSPTREWLAARADAGPVLAALDAFLAAHGWRAAAEIDVSRPRWREDPSLVLLAVRGGLAEPEPGTHRRRHEGLQREGEAAVDRLAAATGVLVRPLVRRLARAHRELFAMREHPKHQLSRFVGILREVVLELAEALHERGVLERREEVWMLELDELMRGPEALERDRASLRAAIEQRRAAYERHARLVPPRVITSEGEVIHGQLADDAELPPGALRGVGVSAGEVEGVVRVVLDPASTTVHAGEVLVAPYADPGWTPLFINAAALVMEVGGMTTHGSVVAREYGIPAVVNVEGAVKALRTGERVRVNGKTGIIERLPETGS